MKVLRQTAFITNHKNKQDLNKSKIYNIEESLMQLKKLDEKNHSCKQLKDNMCSSQGGGYWLLGFIKRFL